MHIYWNKIYWNIKNFKSRRFLFGKPTNLRKQPTFRDATTGPRPPQKASEKRSQKFDTDDASLPRSG